MYSPSLRAMTLLRYGTGLAGSLSHSSALPAVGACQRSAPAGARYSGVGREALGGQRSKSSKRLVPVWNTVASAAAGSAQPLRYFLKNGSSIRST
jgi:hypothetical protein